MLAFAVALASVAIVLCLIDLLLTVGVIRRLRQDNERRREQEPPVTRLGGRVGAFDAVTSRGEPISQEFFSGGTTLVGVFAEGCPPCEEQVPEFIAHARDFPGGRNRVLALVLSMGGNAAAKIDELARVATVVEERHPEGPVGSALRIQGYPTYCIVGPRGVIRVAGATLDELASQRIGS